MHRKVTEWKAPNVYLKFSEEDFDVRQMWQDVLSAEPAQDPPKGCSLLLAKAPYPVDITKLPFCLQLQGKPLICSHRKQYLSIL